MYIKERLIKITQNFEIGEKSISLTLFNLHINYKHKKKFNTHSFSNYKILKFQKVNYLL
jgi:hypothetical protein